MHFSKKSLPCSETWQYAKHVENFAKFHYRVYIMGAWKHRPKIVKTVKKTSS